MTITTGGTMTWMAYGTLVGAALAVIAWGVARWQLAAGRPTRFVWLAGMVAMVLVPVVVAIRPRAVHGVPGASLELPTTSARGAPMASPVRMVDVAAVAWGLGSAAVMLAIGVGMAALARARRRGAITTWLDTAVVETDDVGPGAAPWGHPAILIPRALRRLPDQAAHLLLAHEREHVAAGDARLLLGATVLLIVCPWNLPLWWCFRRLRTAIECDCDARVLQRGAPLGAYASLLLDLVVPRSRPLPALLSLANSSSQLRTRIDAMTTTPSFTPARRVATGLLMVLAGVAACETRMPAPVAPVADYIVKDGQAAPVVISGDNRDSVRASLLEGVQLSLSSADTSTSPVLVVRDANNTVVYSARLQGARDSVLAGIAPDGIESVEVIKGRDVLPEGARGGMIIMRLKAGASWKGLQPGAPSSLAERPITPPAAGSVRVRDRGDSSAAFRARGDTLSVLRKGGDSMLVVRARGDSMLVVRDRALRVVRDSISVLRARRDTLHARRAPGDSIPTLLERPVTALTDSGAMQTGRVRLRALQRDGYPTIERPLPAAADSAATRSVGRPPEPVVSVIDADGREVWSGRLKGREVGGEMHFGDSRVLTTDIARVEVFKGPQAPEGGLIQVHLKVGVKVAKP